MAGKLIELLDKPEQLRTLGNHAVGWARQRFDPEISAAAHINFFQELLDERAEAA